MNFEHYSEMLDNSEFEAALEISNDLIWILQVDEVKKLRWITSEENFNKFGILDKVTSWDFWKEHLHSEDKVRVLKDFQTAFTDINTIHFEQDYRFLGRNGECFFIHDKMKFQRETDGRVKKVLGVWRDLTSTKKNKNYSEESDNSNQSFSFKERDFSDQEFLLNELQRFAKIGCWNYDIESESLFWSNEMYKIHGVDRSFQINKPEALYELYDLDSVVLILEKFSNIELNKFLPFDITVRLKIPLNDIRWVRISAYPILENEKLKRIIGLTYDITQFKDAEENLRLSEEKFSKIFKNNPDLTTLYRESDSLLIDVNKNVEKVLGYSREEVVGKFAKEIDLFVDPGDLVRFLEDYKDDGYAQIETLWKRKDNTIIQVQITSSRIEIAGENYAVNIIKDITTEKAATEKFKKAFDLSPGLMVIMRECDRALIDVSDRVEEIFGYEHESIISKSTFDYNLWANTEDRDKYYSILNQYGSVEMESVMRRKSGEFFYASINTKRIQLSGENHFLILIQDITEKKLAESKIKESEAKLDAIINNTDLYIWSIDTEFKITALNNVFRESIKNLFGLEYEIGESEHAGTSIPNNLYEYWTSLYKRVLNREIVSDEFELNGNFFHTSLHPIIENSKVIGVSVYARDITERKGEEDKLMLSEANLTATVNNTNLFVFSVNRDLNLIMFNEPFKKYIKEQYGIELQLGKTIIQDDNQVPQLIQLKKNWQDRYRRALAGETIKFIEQMQGRTYEFSLNQILERGKITGVSVFVNDITERVKREVELAGANKKIGELKLMALRSIMNPHFIFNALNSIQYFILHNDRVNAINYLSTFSKLVRSILDNTINNKIKLSEEVEQLNYYISLEQLRFEDKFDFVLKIDDDINLESIEIPSLLIQPFVENAILHGLCNKQGDGVLKVSISKEGSFVLFEIEDDGIGREESMNFRKNSDLPKHKSMGSSLTKERLKLINLQSQVTFEIIDLLQNGKPAGTKVKIWVTEDLTY